MELLLVALSLTIQSSQIDSHAYTTAGYGQRLRLFCFSSFFFIIIKLFYYYYDVSKEKEEKRKKVPRRLIELALSDLMTCSLLLHTVATWLIDVQNDYTKKP